MLDHQGVNVEFYCVIEIMTKGMFVSYDSRNPSERMSPIEIDHYSFAAPIVSTRYDGKLQHFLAAVNPDADAGTFAT